MFIGKIRAFWRILYFTDNSQSTLQNICNNVLISLKNKLQNARKPLQLNYFIFGNIFLQLLAHSHT